MTVWSGDPGVAFTVVMLTGLFQVLFGYLRGGRFVNLMPYPVISGFMTGIGCILIIMQLDPLLGYPGPAGVLNALSVLPDYLAHPHWQAVLVGGVAIGLCFGTPPAVNRVVPAPLLALIAGGLLAHFLGGVATLGEVPAGPPSLQVPAPELALPSFMVTSALVLATLGSIDSLLTSLVADNATGTFHDSDKELVGQGIGNFAAGLVGAGLTLDGDPAACRGCRPAGDHGRPAAAGGAPAGSSGQPGTGQVDPAVRLPRGGTADGRGADRGGWPW